MEQRVIKFRCWDVLESKFVQDDNFIYKELADQAMYNPEKSAYYILQQFTGIKDKNGKEIYEGDVFDKETGDDFYGVVEWDKDHWAINWGGGEKDAFSDYHMNGFLVIGNKFSNPELTQQS